MRFERKALLAALAKAKVASVASGSLPPVLSRTVRVTAETVTATDLETFVTSPVDGQGEGEVVVVLPLKALLGALGKGPGEVVIDREEGNRVKVVAPECSGSLHGFDPEDWPVEPDRPQGTSLTLRTSTLLPRLDWVAKAILPPGKGRLHLECLFVSEREDLVATDGHRLHLTPCPELEALPALAGAMIPGGAVNRLASLLREGLRGKRDPAVRVVTDGKLLEVTGERWTARVMLRHGERFPPYLRVIPNREQATLCVTVDAAALVTLIKRLIASVRSRAVSFRVEFGEGELRLWSLGEENHEASGAIHARVRGSWAGKTPEGTPLWVCGAYLLDAVSQPGGGEIALGLTEPKEALRIDGPSGELAVVMPKRP